MTHSYCHDLDRIPPIYREEMRLYLEQGRMPRSRALKALLAGDFVAAIERVDGFGEATLATVTRFLKRHAPAFAWGSPERMAKWEFVGGLETRVPRRRRA